MTAAPLTLRAAAETLAAPLPGLLAQANQLATTMILGDHGRRRPGMGDTFWQYRPATPSDDARRIDWRRSARSDAAFVQDKEWQIAQTVILWVDAAASMQFSGHADRDTKAARARLLGLATAILLTRGGERVGLTGLHLPPGRGSAHLEKLATLLTTDSDVDYGTPSDQGMLPHSRALFLSDFLGDFDGVETAVLTAADRGIKGALLQILDPQEEEFPFSGRTIFESMGGTLAHETLQAGDLRARYLARLADRKDQLAHLARTTGWRFMTHHTGQPATTALQWVHEAIRQT